MLIHLRKKVWVVALSFRHFSIKISLIKKIFEKHNFRQLGGNPEKLGKMMEQLFIDFFKFFEKIKKEYKGNK